MNIIGASTEKRDINTRYYSIIEILETIGAQGWPIHSSYICGSTFEGSATAGLQSDCDRVFVDEGSPVVQSPPETHQYSNCLLMVHESSTPAGYVKLQLVAKGEPLVGDPNFHGNFHILSKDMIAFKSCDKDGMIVLRGSELFNTYVYDVRKGPAYRCYKKKNQSEHDLVLAVRCQKWPYCALE